MHALMEIEQEKETKLESAKIEDGFYNIIGGQRISAARELSARVCHCGSSTSCIRRAARPPSQS